MFGKVLLICLLLLGNADLPVRAQSAAAGDKHVGRTFFLRNSLIFFDYPRVPRVSPKSIEFVVYHAEFNENRLDVYRAPVLNRGRRVEIKDIAAERGLAAVTFAAGGKDYRIYLSADSKREFESSFRLAFSDRVFKVPFCKSIRTKEKLFKCYGFPVYVTTESGSERYFYFLEFVPEACGSFDGCWIRITPKELDMSGYI